MDCSEAKKVLYNVSKSAMLMELPIRVVVVVGEVDVSVSGGVRNRRRSVSCRAGGLYALSSIRASNEISPSPAAIDGPSAAQAVAASAGSTWALGLSTRSCHRMTTWAAVIVGRNSGFCVPTARSHPSADPFLFWLGGDGRLYLASS